MQFLVSQLNAPQWVRPFASMIFLPCRRSWMTQTPGHGDRVRWHHSRLGEPLSQPSIGHTPFQSTKQIKQWWLMMINSGYSWWKMWLLTSRGHWNFGEISGSRKIMILNGWSFFAHDFWKWSTDFRGPDFFLNFWLTWCWAKLLFFLRLKSTLLVAWYVSMAVLIVFGCHTSPSKLANFDEFPMLKGNAASASRDAVLFVSHDEMRPLFGTLRRAFPCERRRASKKVAWKSPLKCGWLVGLFFIDISISE